MSYKTRPLKKGCPPKVERVRLIAGLMAKAQYRGLQTIEELATCWGIKEDTVRDDVAEAGRSLKVTPGEMESTRAMMAQFFQTIAHEAKTHMNKLGQPDYKAALEAMTKYGIYSGIADKVALEAELNADRSPIKVEVTYAAHEALGDSEGPKKP